MIQRLCIKPLLIWLMTRLNSERYMILSVYDPWFSPIVIGQVKWSERIKSALRVEYYQDRTGIRVKNAHPNGFATTAVSVNMDYAVWKGLVWRIEASNYRSRDQVFLYPETPTATNFFLISSLAYRF
jgi:hypothetical protein